jgi:DNA-binding NarL/FixJ family response regulator
MTSPPAHGDGRTIFLIDGWSAFRRSFRLFVEAAGYQVVGEADNADEAVGSASLAAADVVVLDPGQTRHALADDLAMLRSASLRCAFVLLPAAPLDLSVVTPTLHLGVCAYLTKNADPADLLNALAVAAAGRFVVVPRHVLEHAPPADPPVLTRREHEVLTLAAEGHSDARIAGLLWVEEQSVRFHLANIFRKLRVKDRIGAIRTAQYYGLIDRWRLWPELPPDVDGDTWPEKP